MFKKLLILLLAIIVAFLAYVAMQPAGYSVARSAEMAATPEAIFPHINSLKKFDVWSPWAKVDPNAVMTYEGPEDGKGAIGKWKGNSEVGEGSMTIVDSNPSSDVKMKLDFVSPFPATADVAFAVEPKGANTKVTWTMLGEHNFVMRAMCILMRHDIDQMIGEKYEEGLANLKKIVEAG